MQNPPQDTRRRRWSTVSALAVFLAGTAVVFLLNGVLITRDAVFLWVIVGLLAISISDMSRWLRGVIFDWLPFAGALFLYDLLRGLVGQDPLFTPHVYPQIDADVFLFGSVPPESMQESLFSPLSLAWYDYAAWAVYITHFFATFVIAALLWRYAYPRFRQFRTLVLTLTAMAFVTYALFPAVPPWMASDMGAIGSVERVVADVWGALGVDAASAIWAEGSTFSNEVAAVPSLHTAYPVLIMLFFWPSGWWARGLGLAYALAMSVTLVYTGEHWVFDIILGWLYAGAAFGVVALGGVIGRRLRQRWPDRLGPAAPAPAPAPVTAAVAEPRIADS
jgi:PAP2 superfamily